MTFPFTALSAAARQEGLIVAVLIGIAFGFVLERAGFGRADNLAAQFYLRDMRVFKVMFSAIVTAMLGLVTAAGLGLTNLREISESIASFTFIGPMLVGGFVLGVGFIVSGYCPGTSVVAAASGNVDGAITVAGVVTGTFIYSKLLLIPAFQHFHESGDHGSWFLYDVIKVPPALIAAAVAAMAILAFIGAEKVESMMGGARTAARVRRFAFATILGAALLSGGQALLPVPVRAQERQARVPALHGDELRRTAIETPWLARGVDTRSFVGGGQAAPPPPVTPAPGGVIVAPKKKGGGCSA
ncbi:MAG TPA: YeeE/YedE thiosulfate transporter family protein [Thermoanaerobaculia bacterium]|nr:YeeE/YedE thiosulfate transporter family protein [Thermoanaerobaculia bacterium]